MTNNLKFCSVCPFTRDMDQVRAKLLTTSCEDKTSLEVGLKGFVSLIQVGLNQEVIQAVKVQPFPGRLRPASSRYVKTKLI